ncbi:MAG TPA: selenocysteine-specific translation elongation factor, partial [Candidatus Saccharimonadales bacterium]|nr:selenocysteine-specific translation elongation factor [Candidatus Saccharimonadales bacterium]
MSEHTKSVIVGTAGHIDHGKSALVEALTGTHPDRLPEERKRGITIDLGFAFLEQSGVRFGFVDVPGHERFVSNMLAGAAGMDLVLLVVAANESVKPQTREHFAICRLLGVERGIVVLTKCDLVDRDTAELARMEIAEFLRGSFLENAAILAVSAKTGAGLEELKTALLATAREVRGRDATRSFRLPIDRAFAMKGFGTVVTGTLVSGSVCPGDEAELFPGKERLRVRGVQCGGKTVERSYAGQRTAVNLAGIEHTAVQRGMVLGAPGKYRTTWRADVRLELLGSAPKLKQRTKVHFHSGTSETVAEVILHGVGELLAGQTAWGQLRFQNEVVLQPGDRFIVRQLSPATTIGGGLVLDALARRPMARDTGRATYLETLESGKPLEILAAMTLRSVLGLQLDEIALRTGWTEQEIRDTAEKLAESKRLCVVADEPLVLVSSSVYEDTLKKILGRVERFQKENPLRPGIAREDLRTALGRRVKTETFRAAVGELLVSRKLEVQGDIVRKAGTAIELLPEEATAKGQIEAAFASAGLAVPAVTEVLKGLPVEAK